MEKTLPYSSQKEPNLMILNFVSVTVLYSSRKIIHTLMQETRKIEKGTENEELTDNPTLQR